ncbi:MAG: DUF1403 family protein [Roseobacter sp.]
MRAQLPEGAFERSRLPNLQSWVTSRRAETVEAVTFRSGSALTVLNTLVADLTDDVPLPLLASRLALKAATATSKLEGRMAGEGDIRDAFYLASGNNARGPDGELLAFWHATTRLRMTGKDSSSQMRILLGPVLEGSLDGWLAAGAADVRSLGPLAGCVAAMRLVLEVDDRAERQACLMADIILARALNWKTVLPISALGMTKGMLRNLVAGRSKADLIAQQSLLSGIEDTIGLARVCAQRTAALKKVAPKLRAKGSDAAVGLFLSENAVSPSSMMSPIIQGTTVPMTDRAARRFCDRLVELGVARELTGRSAFRFYGILP